MLKNKLFNKNAPRKSGTAHLSPERSEDLSSIRIIQKNLVYLKNLPASVATEQTLSSKEYFGSFGSIQKCIIVPSYPYYKAYITFNSAEEASACISSCNNMKVGANILELTLGTTRYCNYFINGNLCPRKNCFFLHERMIDAEINRAVQEKPKMIQSRFSFAQGAQEPEKTRGLVEELLEIASPSQQTPQLSPQQYEAILTGTETWACDIFKADISTLSKRDISNRNEGINKLSMSSS